MIEAALRGKPLRLHAEDSLTATVFGRLCYLPDRLLWAWLRGARPFAGDAVLQLGVGQPSVRFWPTWPDTFRGARTVEPDVVIETGSSLCVIEASTAATSR